ncbi:N-6 DNA methylase [Klebsiella variicola]|uniref:N-6 DNA methylase n=2 Tax=Klebsiella/Raoultella group TaxID=2890311 RepID=UPI002FF50470
MSAPPLTPTARSALAAQLVLASLHPQRAGPVPRGHTGPAPLVAELGQAFLAARGGFNLNGLPLWDGLPDEDPWFLFRAAKTAWRALSWYEHRLQQTPADDVRQWQQHASQLLATHYGQAPEDTTLTLDSVARGHLANGTAPRMAVSALARLYGWPRTDGDEGQDWLFSPDLSPVCDALAAFTLNPARLHCYRGPVEQNMTPCPPALPTDSPSLMLPPPADTTRLPAANDNGDPSPDTPPACQAVSSPAPEDAETPPDNLVALPWVSRTGQPNPHRATFLRQFRETAPHENRWTVFSDLMHLSAAALHNRLAFSQDIEDDYLRRIGRYNRADRFRFQALFQTLVDGMEHSASDFLGSVFMELELGNPDNGQYFTPFSVSHMMARMLLADRQAELDSGEREYISVCDPACGAGGMIVAMACAMLEAGYNPQRQMVAFCTDIDPVPARPQPAQRTHPDVMDIWTRCAGHRQSRHHPAPPDPSGKQRPGGLPVARRAGGPDGAHG